MTVRHSNRLSYGPILLLPYRTNDNTTIDTNTSNDTDTNDTEVARTGVEPVSRP